jgi:hypothetical protein
MNATDSQVKFRYFTNAQNFFEKVIEGEKELREIDVQEARRRLEQVYTYITDYQKVSYPNKSDDIHCRG